MSNDSIENFLRRIFGHVPPDHHVAIWSLPSRTTRWARVDQLAAAARIARDRDESGEDPYFSVCPHATRPIKGRGTKATVGCVPSLWLDIDIASPAGAHKADADSLPPDVDAAFALIDSIAGLPVPTMVVDSGYGLHLYWVLTAPLSADAGAQLVERLQRVAQAAATAKGYHLDSTHDIARVLRVPGTRNRKISGAVREVQVLLDDGPEHDAAAFDAIVTRAEQVDDVRGDVAERPAAAAHDPDRDPSRAMTLAEVRAALGKVKRDESRALVAKMLKGESIAPRGKRDAAMQKVCSVVAFTAPDNDPVELAELFRPMLSEWAAEEGAKLTLDEEIDKAVDKIDRAQSDKRKQRAAAEREAEEWQIREEQAAEAAGVAVEDLRKLYIVQTREGGHFYLRREDRSYVGPYGSKAWPTKARDALAWSPVELFDAKGKPRPEREVLHQHASVAERTIARLMAQQTEFDPASATLIEATCPVRELEPERNAQIDAWLRLLGGAEADKLLDWLATVTQLDRPTSILYLEGAKSSGKSMLALGLARLYVSEGGPTTWATAISRFNGRVAHCPLIWADEKLEGDDSSIVRRMTNDDMEVEDKYQPRRSVDGNPRIIITANNDGLLNFARERFERPDIDAVALRFLHIKIEGEAAANYLRELGGRAATEGWVDGDAIARHILWLRATRAASVKAGSRFLVEGQATQMANTLAVKGRRREAVATWLVNCLSTDISTVQGVICGGGQVLVSVLGMYRGWDAHIQDTPSPSVVDIGKDLAPMSTGTMRPRIEGKRTVYHKVDVEQILAFAAQHGLADVEDLRARINRPLSNELRDSIAQQQLAS